MKAQVRHLIPLVLTSALLVALTGTAAPTVGSSFRFEQPGEPTRAPDVRPRAGLEIAGPLTITGPTIVSYQGSIMVSDSPYDGIGYFKFAIVNTEGNTTYWSNDGTSTGGGQPATAVNLSVSDGLFSVNLGDTGMPALTHSVFAGPGRYLRVWFSTTSGGTFTQLPGVVITAVPYALNAETLDGFDSDILWKLTGNSGTTANSFLGTTDNMTLTLAVNNTVGLRLIPTTTGSPNVIGGDISNTVTLWPDVYGATIGGGGSDIYPNRVIYSYGTVGGGEGNIVSSVASVIGGGRSNTSGGGYAATVCGGEGNTASGDYDTVGGGQSNTASGGRSTVGGGSGNIASEYHATIPGGYNNTAQGAYSFAAGRRAKANNTGCFVWGDSTNADVACNNSNAFVIRASGGVTLYTNSGLTSGAFLAAGSGSWTSVSDRNLKANITAVKPDEVLSRLARVQVSTWNYESQDPSIRHIGPMAQDFYGAFGVGETDTGITTVDADGVALAAIQGLYQLVQEKDTRITDLEARLKTQEQKNADLEARVAAVEKAVGDAPRTASNVQLSWLEFGGLALGVLFLARSEYRHRSGR